MLSGYRERVREGFLVDDALDFARFIRMSGLADLMAANPPCGETAKHTQTLRKLFPYDASALRYETDLLEAECHEYFRGRTKDAEGTPAGVSMSKMESIDRSLQLIAGHLAGVVAVKRRSVAKPKLRVVEGPSGLVESFLPPALLVGGLLWFPW